MRGSWYPEFVHIHVFMEIHETINNNPLNCFEFHPYNYKNMAFKSIQPETCFGKLWGRMTQPVKRFNRAMRYIYDIKFGMLQVHKNEISLRKCSGSSAH